MTLETKDSTGSMNIPKWIEIPKYPVIVAVSVRRGGRSYGRLVFRCKSIFHL
jgi:hypothetical protein